MRATIDEDAILATCDLVGRTGATELQLGYLHDDVPIEQAAWWAHAQYRGARIAVEEHRGPVEALEALARRLLTGAKCTHCQGLVSLSDPGAVAYDSHMSDGSFWTAQDAAKAGLCRWRRMGDRWARGCEVPRG